MFWVSISKLKLSFLLFSPSFGSKNAADQRSVYASPCVCDVRIKLPLNFQKPDKQKPETKIGRDRERRRWSNVWMSIWVFFYKKCRGESTVLYACMFPRVCLSQPRMMMMFRERGENEKKRDRKKRCVYWNWKWAWTRKKRSVRYEWVKNSACAYESQASYAVQNFNICLKGMVYRYFMTYSIQNLFGDCPSNVMTE